MDSDEEISFHPRHFSTQVESVEPEVEVHEVEELPDPELEEFSVPEDLPVPQVEEFSVQEAEELPDLEVVQLPPPPHPEAVPEPDVEPEDEALPPFPELPPPAFDAGQSPEFPLPPPPFPVAELPAVVVEAQPPSVSPVEGEESPSQAGAEHSLYVGPFVQQEGKRKGTINFVADGKVYRRDYVRREKLYVKCTLKDQESCRGRAHIEEDVLTQTYAHSCTHNTASADALRIKALCKGLSEESSASFRQIFDEACEGSEGASLIG